MRFSVIAGSIYASLKLNMDETPRRVGVSVYNPTPFNNDLDAVDRETQEVYESNLRACNRMM